MVWEQPKHEPDYLLQAASHSSTSKGMPATPHLIVYNDDQECQTYVITEQVMQIGRSQNADIHIADEKVSGTHVSIRLYNDQVLIEDTNSTNGVYLNGTRISRTQLAADALVQIGDTILKIEYKNATKTQTDASRLHRATIDPLSGIPNRSYFELRVCEELRASRRRNLEVGLALLDIDELRSINTLHGESTGDFIISQLGFIVASQKRLEDLHCRWASGQFCLFLRGPINKEQILRFCSRLQTLVHSAPFEFAEKKVAVSVCIGCTTVSVCEQTELGMLIKNADQAMYSAKSYGHNTLRYFP